MDTLKRSYGVATGTPHVHNFCRVVDLEVDVAKQCDATVFAMCVLRSVLLGLTCGDEFLCNTPDTPEHCRKSPSRGTELCAIVESMFSYNEMFSIHGDIVFADRAERIA
eukprot:SAG31_NODE_2295_length_5989_cov_3.461630_4_plen_109_part_00